MRKDSFECLSINPNDQKSNCGPPQPTKLLSINPLNIIIEYGNGQTVKTLELKNIYPCRVAFRILCNGPTRYVVYPNKGFIGIAEKTKIQITLIDTMKYQSNHAFIVQAMPTPGDFTDRKTVWIDQKQHNILRILTNTRVRTMRPAQASTSHSSSSELPSPMPLSTVSSISENSIPNTNNQKSPETNRKIEELVDCLRKAADEKTQLTREMVKVVNEIKSIEVELDRQTQLVNELNGRLKNGEVQYTNLVLRENYLREELEICRQKLQNSKKPR